MDKKEKEKTASPKEKKTEREKDYKKLSSQSLRH